MNRNFNSKFLTPHPDGGGGAPPVIEKSAENAIIEKLKTVVAEQVRSANGSEEQKTLLKSIFENMLGGMTQDQLRASAEDQVKLKQDIADMASKFEKMSQRNNNGGGSKLVKSGAEVLAKHVNDNFEAIEQMLNLRNSQVDYNINLRAAEIVTTTNAVDLSGLTVEDLSNATSITGFVEKRKPREYIFDIADRTTVPSISKTKTWTSEGTTEGEFTLVGESELKPMVSASLVENKSVAQKVAGHTVYTDEVAKFKREAYLLIRRLINDKLLRDYQNILTTGLYAAAAQYVGSALDGQYPNPTDFHAIAAVAAQIEALDFNPDILILNPQDKWRIGMSQNENGSFYMAIPASSPDTAPTMLGFRVITSNKIPVGNFLLGESGLWKIEDESVTIKIGYGITQVMNEAGTAIIRVEDDLTYNRFRVISEMFFHSYIDPLHTGSFVVGNFDVIKDLLTSETAPEEGGGV